MYVNPMLFICFLYYLEGGISQPTPKYNSSILEDMFQEDNADFVKKTICRWQELGEALILLKVWYSISLSLSRWFFLHLLCTWAYNFLCLLQVWARQRSSIYVHDCLNGYIISILLSYLVSLDKINKSMKAVQILRVVLDFIGMLRFKFLPFHQSLHECQ